MDLTVELLRSVDASVRAAHPRVSARAHLRPRRRVEARAAPHGHPRPHRERPATAPSRSRIGHKEHLTEAVLNDEAELGRLFEQMAGRDVAHRTQAAPRSKNHGERVFLLYELLAEPVLTQLYRTPDGTKSVPVFITEYPFEVSPLARRNDQNPRGSTALSSLSTAARSPTPLASSTTRTIKPNASTPSSRSRRSGDEEAMDYDADYIRALSHGMPPAAGFGMGVDRLAMMLCGASIHPRRAPVPVAAPRRERPSEPRQTR
jgi:lysyl-tRNA synthetase class 2